jgi:hypothetical protein
MRVYVPCAILSGLGFWLVSGFGQFLSGLAPGRFAKIRKFCPDRDQTVCAIDRGPDPCVSCQMPDPEMTKFCHFHPDRNSQNFSG